MGDQSITQTVKAVVLSTRVSAKTGRNYTMLLLQLPQDVQVEFLLNRDQINLFRVAVPAPKPSV